MSYIGDLKGLIKEHLLGQAEELAKPIVQLPKAGVFIQKGFQLTMKEGMTLRLIKGPMHQSQALLQRPTITG